MHTEEVYERSVCIAKNCSQQFRLENETLDYQRQYCYAYAARLAQCSDRLLQAAQSKWGNSVEKVAIADVKEGERCVVIGTTFKQQTLKPSILKELCEDINALPQPVGVKLEDESDVLVLEDPVQRITLTGNIKLGDVVSGIPMALIGLQNSNGRFEVEDYTFIPQSLPTPVETSTDEECFLVLVSGLEFVGVSDDDGKTLFRAEFFAEWLTGELGQGSEQAKAAKIARLVLVGNLISEKAQDKEFTAQAKYLSRKGVTGSVEAVKNLDTFLSCICPSIEIDVMPGPFDPTNYQWPQQPLHPCTFPEATPHSTLHQLPNPYLANVRGLSIVGTSGKNVDDVFRFCGLEDRLSIAENLLKWGHLCPTSPDTLESYPYRDSDPFILETTPHIFFIGNQPEFKYKRIKGSDKSSDTLIICVPKFKERGECVLVNLCDFSVECVNFDTSFVESFHVTSAANGSS